MRLELHFGDITEYKADCIVNAARNSYWEVVVLMVQFIMRQVLN
jgi:hypothetical protein